MPAVVVNAPPFIPVKPKLMLGTAPDTVEFACAANSLEVSPEQDETTVETFCGSYTTYKPEVWTITATVFQSYGTAAPPGLWNALRPLVGTVVDFEILPTGSAAVGPTNPSAKGKCLVKAFPFYSGAVGEPTSFDVELAVQGTPVFATV
jgi:hypothetical protein